MKSRMWWGIVLVVLGVLFLLDNVNVVDFGDVVSTFWPLLFVFWGTWILLRKKEPHVAHASGPSASQQTIRDAGSSTNAGSLNYSNILGDYRVHVDSQAFSGGSVTTVFGDTEIVLSNASLAEGDHTLKTSGVFGTTRVRLSPGMEFSLSSNTLLGELELNHQRQEGFSPTMTFQTPGFAGASKRLRIIASQVFGDVVVRN
ncbi:MAG: cell wall-active antibiotics response protein LiaF [Bacteroidota bacterium]